jgi:adenosylhomocysteine nucleosidase
MKGNLLLIAALSGELKPLVTHRGVKGWRRVPSTKGTEVWERTHADGRWLAVCAGMGARRAVLAFAEAEKTMQPDAVCSIGWAGALDAGIRSGEVWGASLVVDTQTGERFRPANCLEGSPVLVTSARVADSKEKARLAASYGAGLIDMEAAAVARIALGKGIPFYCMKAVSDDSSADLPDINPFIGLDGQLNILPFLLHIALRPASWAGLAKLGRNSNAAAKNLAEAIYAWLDPCFQKQPQG